MISIEEIYNRYYKDIYMFVLALSKDSHVAEDISQEAFVKAMKSLQSFRGDCDIRVWLCQIAKNTYFSMAKKQQREVSDIEDELANRASDYDFVQNAIDQEQAKRIRTIVNELNEPYKEVFYLRVFGELSFKQIAELYGKTESWARVTFHRTRLMVLEAMEE